LNVRILDMQYLHGYPSQRKYCSLINPWYK
jgi:hypothetical protein